MSEEAELGEAVLRISTDGNGLRLGIEEAHVAALGMQKRLDEVHNHIKDRFAEKFEHIGVHTFGHQLLGMVGVTEGARPILGALKLGVSTLAESFGVAAGPIGFVVMGLTAMTAIGWKIHESHEKHAESLAKVLKEESEVLTKTTELKEKFVEYERVVGRLPHSLDAVHDATKRLDKIQRQNLTTTEGQMMASLQRQMDANRDQRSALQEYITELTRQQSQMSKTSHEYSEMGNVIGRVNGQMRGLKEAGETLHASFEKTKADIKAQADGFASLEDKLAKTTKATEEHAEAVKKEEAAFDSWNKKIEAQLELAAKAGVAWEESQKKSGAAIENLGVKTKEIEQDGAAATTNAYKKREAEIAKYQIMKRAEIDLIHKTAIEAARSDAQVLAADQQYAAAKMALDKTVAQKSKENHGSLATAVISAGKTMESSFAHGAASAIMSSTNMKTAATAISRQIAEQIIADTIAWGVAEAIQTARSVAGHTIRGGAAIKSAAVQVAADGFIIKSTIAKSAAVDVLTASLAAATTAAIALDIALAAAI